MNRDEIINYLIKKFGYTRYLEIGIANSVNFSKINCKYKDGVDPRRRKANYFMTSDEFFSTIKNNKRYDIIFIDGLHIEEQVDRDIRNSLKHLLKNGTIVLHDCNPPTWKHQVVPMQQTAWNGTVWKSFVKLRVNNPNLEMFVVKDNRGGCGIIRRGNQKLYNKAPLEECLKYEYFDKHRKELLNLISSEEFVNKINGENNVS